MNLVENNKGTLKVCQPILIVCMLPILINLYLPSSFTGKSIGLLILNIIACVGLIAIAVRVNFKNVRKWEMILYHLLNIVFVIVIAVSAIELSDIAVDVARDKIPYAKGTEEYYDAYEDIDSDALSAMFAFVIFGILGIIMSIIFAIVGTIKTFVQKNENLDKQIALNNGTSIKINDNEIDSNSSLNNVKVNYCSYCGKQIDNDAKFCKHCGKEIEYRK